MSGNPQPERMALDDLAHSCRVEMDRFFDRKTSDDRYCFELFRRALQLRNEYAWAALFEHYGNLVRGWIRRCPGSESVHLSIDEMMTLSFERFWHAIALKERFAEFESLPALLQYLRTCCSSVVRDRLRYQRFEYVLDDLEPDLPFPGGDEPSKTFLEIEQAAAFWTMVLDLLQDEQEKRVVIASFVYDMAPRQIQARYPEDFPAVEAVYRIKRNVINRLRRVEELRDFFGE